MIEGRVERVTALPFSREIVISGRRYCWAWFELSSVHQDTCEKIIEREIIVKDTFRINYTDSTICFLWK
jgi:hypothetical protein